MRVKDIFNQQKDNLIYSIVSDTTRHEILENRIVPIDSPILSEEFIPQQFCPDDRIQGSFLIKAKIVFDETDTIPAFFLLTMPELIIDFILYKENETIFCDSIGLSKYRVEKDIVSMVAVNKGTKYFLYYSPLKPDIGINVLLNAIDKSRIKYNYARCLGYIYRDEKRYEEAIGAFSLAISEKDDFCSDYIERACLYDKINDLNNADRDWQIIKKRWGSKVVEYNRQK